MASISSVVSPQAINKTFTVTLTGWQPNRTFNYTVTQTTYNSDGSSTSTLMSSGTIPCDATGAGQLVYAVPTALTALFAALTANLSSGSFTQNNWIGFQASTGLTYSGTGPGPGTVTGGSTVFVLIN